MRSVAAIIATSAEVTFGTVLSWGENPHCVQRVPLVFLGCRLENSDNVLDGRGNSHRLHVE